MKKSDTFGIHWFRRDLRVFGNSALQANLNRNQGRVLGFFCFDSQFLSRSDFSANRFAFFLKTLQALKEELQAQGGDLLIVDSLPRDAFPQLIDFFKEKTDSGKPSLISWSRDYEPFARNRDAEIASLLDRLGVESATDRDHLILEPTEIMKSEKADDFYQVYTPYSRKWFAAFARPDIQSRIRSQVGLEKYVQNLSSGKLKTCFTIQWKSFLAHRSFPFQDACEIFEKKNSKHVTVKIPEAGLIAAFNTLKDFKKSVADYNEARDVPSVRGTSGLSIYFKNGSLTTSQVIAYLGLEQINGKTKNGATQFVKELVWREFYYAILFHRPDLEKTSFRPQYADLKWENSTEWFKAWQEGKTGFPIVDAGMRQLLQTGWMHNRVRMIVASFLTKDLLIDWKWGEAHFMKYLLDGDLAPNNGGWQWAASTGCDPQPYFRIFNPWLQSKRFDPQGEYIKRYVPELQNVSAKNLHNEEAARPGYPTPIVEHSLQRPRALALYRKPKSTK